VTEDPQTARRVAVSRDDPRPGGISFGQYRLELDRPRLRKGDEPVALQPRPLAVLCYLAARPGVIVGRDELIEALWAGIHVTKAVLKVAVRAIREALADDADAPRYIETVGREGYRFIGLGGSTAAASTAPPPAATPSMVGRVRDLAALHAAFARASDGARSIVFVTGEAGIGKTTLIDRFVEDVGRRGTARVARGQCLEQYGEGEAYLPVLEAFGSLARGDGAPELVETLSREAPTWVSHLPALAPHARASKAIGAMPARMLREMADALEVLTRRTPLVRVLEDLQWSDRSTVDLIAYVARRRRPARLMIAASLRPAEVIVHDHPLRAVRQELQANGSCTDLSLELLSLHDVTAYVAARFGSLSPDLVRRLAARVYDRTDGNALFTVNVVNDLVACGVLVWRDRRWLVEGSIEQATDRIPRGLQELLGRRMDGLVPATRRVLEVASVAGDEFDVATVAAALGDDVDAVEDVCEQLSTQGSLIADLGIAEWPDGSLTGRYRFLHALYRRVLYEGIGEARRVRIHRAIGMREEAAFGARVAERASELAMHFARGRDHQRALEYHELAGSAALDRNAAHEAVAHFSAALDALARRPEGPERTARELALVVASATPLMAIRGYAAPETERAFARARSLCDEVPASPKLYPVLRGLVSYHHVRAELDDARQLGEALLAHAARQADDRALRVQAHYGHGATLFHLGTLDAARAHLEAALRDYDPAAHREHVLTYGGYDPGVGCSMWLAWTLALLGHLDEAIFRDREGLALARRLDDAFSLAWALHAAGVSQQVFGDWAASEASSAEAVRVAEEHGFPHVLGMATVNRGWARVMQGRASSGIPMLRDGVATVEATGAGLVRPSYLGMLATADAIEGNGPSALRRVDEAIALGEQTGERLYEATLLIGKSHLLAGSTAKGAADAAETCLRRALALARAQGARLFELRAAVALARHCQQRCRAAEGRTLLATAHAWFADARPAAPEIMAARQLLSELGA
jgi:DNA-binding winged helix-turn-helix (wHTH) protein/predicted ATPase